MSFGVLLGVLSWGGIARGAVREQWREGSIVGRAGGIYSLVTKQGLFKVSASSEDKAQRGATTRSLGKDGALNAPLSAGRRCPGGITPSTASTCLTLNRPWHQPVELT